MTESDLEKNGQQDWEISQKSIPTRFKHTICISTKAQHVAITH